MHALDDVLAIRVERKPKGAPDSAFSMHREYRLPLAVFRSIASTGTPPPAGEEIRGGDFVYRVKTSVSKDVVSKKLTR